MRGGKYIAIADSGGANMKSLTSAFERIGVEVNITREIDKLEGSRGIVLPGVGRAGEGMEILDKYGLSEYFRSTKKKILGICIGLQVLYESSEEDNMKGGIGIFRGECKRLPVRVGMSVPQMGWNRVRKTNKNSKLLEGIEDGEYFYYVHSYYMGVGRHTVGSSEYTVELTAVAEKDNYHGCQFHPEISGKQGEKVLRNFLEVTDEDISGN